MCVALPPRCLRRRVLLFFFRPLLESIFLDYSQIFYELNKMPSKTRKRFPGLGEGRSKPLYIPPTQTDTAVLIAFFNPGRFKRILKNALYIISILKENKIPCYVVECTFHKHKPQIPGATLVLKSDSYMFYKEQLLNKLEPLVPDSYTKLVFLDADVLLDTPDWIDQISMSLETNDIVQPFNQACWLTPDNTRIRSKKMSYAFAIVTKKTINTNTIHDYHPGFVWGFKREVFRKLGGFFPRSIVGGGDVAFILNLFPIHVTDDLFFRAINSGFGKVILEAWRAYNHTFKTVNPTLGFLANRALHLFHGVKESRQYVTRYEDISKALKGTWDDEIVTNADGLFEFKRKELNTVVLNYFKGRDEDIPLEKAEAIIKSGRRRTRRAQGGRNPIENTPVDSTVVTMPSQ